MRMLQSRLLIFLAVLAASWNCPAQDEDVTLTGTVTARMRLGDRFQDIHPMQTNLKRPPEQWQFRYSPLMVPETSNGHLMVQKVQVGSRWEVSIRIWFDNSNAHTAAIEAVQRSYPDEAARIQPTSVGRIAISDLRFSMELPTGAWQSSSFNPGDVTSRTISVPAATESDATAIEGWLNSGNAVLRISYTFGTRALQENATIVTMQNLRNTTVHQRLDGLPKDNGLVYVHRDQLANLCDRISSQMNRVDWVENPNTFDSVVVDGLLHLWDDRREIDYSQTNAWARSSFFNSEDLAPDKITRDFQRSFTYDATSRTYRINVAGAGAAKASLGPISIGGSASGSYSKEQLDSMLRQHGLEAELDGMIIRPRKLFLQVVNTADFASNKTVANRRLYVGSRESRTEVVDVELRQAILDHAAQQDFAYRLADLDARTSKYERSIVLGSGDASGEVFIVGKLHVRGEVTSDGPVSAISLTARDRVVAGGGFIKDLDVNGIVVRSRQNVNDAVIAIGQNVPEPYILFYCPGGNRELWLGRNGSWTRDSLISKP
jgi:hypothetical protein